MSSKNLPQDKEDTPGIISPFSHTVSTVSIKTTNQVSWPLWVVSGLLVLLILGIIGYFSFKYLNDPYRTLEPFPVAKYLDDYRSLAGDKFKANMKVVADLGWKENVGRLMVFTEEDDNHPVVVLIPPKLSGVFFTKGQDYQVSLEVGEGGLIYADSCEKE